MKNIIHIVILSFSLILFGCASTEQKPIIVSPDNLSEKVELMSVKNVEVIDKRTKQALAFINNTPLPTNSLLIPTMQDWLGSSFTLNPYGSKTVTVELVDYASHVKQETMTFNLESVLSWKVIVSDEEGTWAKTYQSSINEDGPLKADNAIIEKHLNALAITLLDKTVQDPAFKEALYK